VRRGHRRRAPAPAAFLGGGWAKASR
jgi:hypothetical protein